MKIVALTSAQPGIRYSAHLLALHEMGLDVVTVSLQGWRLATLQVSRNLKILKRRGVIAYVSWLRMKRRSAGLRHQVGEYINERSRANPWSDFEVPIHYAFNGFCKDAVKFINAERPDFIFQLGVGLIPSHFVRAVPPILNLHPGILPGIRGVDPVFWAHYYGREDWLGTTLHFIDEGIDTGKPLLRRRLQLHRGVHYAESILQQVEVECELLSLFFANYRSNHLRYDQGGSAVSIYRSAWSAEQYHELEEANWWKARELTANRPSFNPLERHALGAQA